MIDANLRSSPRLHNLPSANPAPLPSRTAFADFQSGSSLDPHRKQNRRVLLQHHPGHRRQNHQPHVIPL